MSLRTLPAFIALCALGGCFTPEYHCRIICNPRPDECPKDFICVTDGTQRLCARMGIEPSCFAPPADAGLTESPPPPTPDAAPDTPVGNENPSELCYAGSCLTLSAEMRQSLVLWLDPSNLPAKDMAVTRWPDRSREGNDAIPLTAQNPPRSRGDGLALSSEMGGPLLIAHDRSLDFDTGDFTVMVVARLAPVPPSCLFVKASFDRSNPQGVVMGWTYSTEIGRTIYRATINGTPLAGTAAGVGDLTPQLFVLRRFDQAVEARVDGVMSAVGVIPRGQSVSTTDNAFLGSCGPTGAPIAVLHAAVVFRGALPTADLTRLEAFLKGSFPPGSP
jgi:hypothetical protein